jgi:hypothetical protein
VYSVAGFPLDGEVTASHSLHNGPSGSKRWLRVADHRRHRGSRGVAPRFGAGSVSLFGWRVRDRSREFGLFGGGRDGLRCQCMKVEVHVALSTLCGFVPPGHPPAGGFPIDLLRRLDRAYGPGRRCVSRLTGRNGVRLMCSSEYSRRVATVSVPDALRCVRCGSPRWTRLVRFGVPLAGRQGERGLCTSVCSTRVATVSVPIALRCGGCGSPR